MRITGVHIDGFGRFADCSFGPLDRPVTVLYGPNEAGKSTLLEFVRRVLFGFPSGQRRVNLYPPLSGGRHGGRITIVTDTGEMITIDRIPGSQGGPVSLTTSAGGTLQAGDLPQLLGNHSRGVFEGIFTFTLDDLTDDSLLSDESVNLQVYSAGIGATKLPGALEALEQQKRGIFLPNGRTQLAYRVAAAMETTASDLQKIAGYATEYRGQSERLAEIERELWVVGERRLELASKKERHENLQRAWEPWGDLVLAEQRMAELPAVEAFPVNGIGLLESFEKQADTAHHDLKAAEEELTRLKLSVDQEINHLTILERSGEVRELERARGAFDQSVKDLPERRTELASKRSELATALANLGTDWDAERLNSFDLSLVVREEVAAHGDRLQKAQTAVGRLQTALAQEETTLTDAREDAERAQADRDNTRPPELNENDMRERRRRIRRSRDTLVEMERVQDRVNDLRAQLNDEPKSGNVTPDSGNSRLVAILLGLGESRCYWLGSGSSQPLHLRPARSSR